MNEKGWVMFQVMMNRYHKGSTEALLSCLSQEEKQKVLGQGIQSTDVKAALCKPSELLRRIHYSWLADSISKIPGSFKPYLLSTLSQDQMDGLATLMEENIPALTVSKPMRIYLMNLLSKEVGAAEILPPSFLPASKLSFLLELTNEQIYNIVDYLGVHDLACEFRQLINQTKLKELMSCLSAKKQAYLKTILKQQEKLIQERIGVEQLNGKAEMLLKILHRRGLIRLAKGLSGCHPDMLWHLQHKVDTGRGKIIEKNWQKDSIPIITTHVAGQISNIVNFLKIKPKETT